MRRKYTRSSAWMMIAFVAVAGCDSGKRKPEQGKAETAKPDPAKVDAAALTAKKYAFEAYPQWAAAHPDKACPDRLEELNEYMTKTDTLDPWGRTYKLMCGPTLPPAARGLAVSSSGADGVEGNADDIKSWE